MKKKEFEILRFLCESHGTFTQRIIAGETGISLGTVNGVLSDFQRAGLINDVYQVTSKGYELIEPFRVDNAIILAAGMSTRFVPFSYERPKGLTCVKGEILIERQIRQLKAAGVKEIVIVLGHMMEKFLYLVDKYDLKVVVNKQYRFKNTHSSLYFAREYLKNSYICCADNYFPENVFHQYEYHSLYSTEFMPGTWRGERGVTSDNTGLIIATQRPAIDQWVINGYAFFNKEFSDQFRVILEDMYDKPGTDNLYWEQVYAEHVHELKLYEKRYELDQVLEFDSVEDLEKFDPEYIKYNELAMTKNICNVLNCDLSDIHGIQPIQKGYTNKSFKFTCRGEAYIYRTPGTISADWLDRKSEHLALENAKRIGIDDLYIYEDPNTGWMISKYIDITDDFCFSNEEHVKKLCSLLRRLYEKPMTCGKARDYLQESKELLRKIQAIDAESYEAAKTQLKDIEAIDRMVKEDGWPIQLVHNDIYEDNILISNDKMYLIDWEYAGDTDIGHDLCKLFVKNNAEGPEIDKWLSFYYERQPSLQEKKHIVGVAAVAFYYWYLWALYMTKRGKEYSDLMLQYLSVTKRYQKELKNYPECP